MRSIEIQNPTLGRTYLTRLSADYASGTTLTVENNTSYQTNDFIVIGEPGEELTESNQVSVLNGKTQLNISSALNFSHSKGTYVRKTLWDFVSIERRTSSAGAFSVISLSPIQWDNHNNLTIYNDPNATDDYGYRYRFYNSSSLEYSEYSPTLTGAGFTRKQTGAMIERIRILGRDRDQKYVTDDDIIFFINQGQNIIYSHNPKYFFLLVDTYKAQTGIAAVADTNVYSLASYTTFGHLDTVRCHYVNGGVSQLYHLLRKSAVEFDRIAGNIVQTTDDIARIYKLLPADSSSANGYIQIYPKTKSTGIDTFYPNYYERMADVNSVDDETQVPVPEILESYAAGQIWRIRGDDTRAEMYEKVLVNVTKNEDWIPPGLVMLDKIDKQQKDAVGQPRSLWNFRGQKAMSRLYGTAFWDRDTYKENYME